MIEFKLVLGDEASKIDPDKIQWPFDTLVLYAFDGGKVIGRAAIMNLPVIEGSWVDPEYRGTSLAVRMQREVEKLLVDLKKTHAIAIAYDEQPKIREYLSRFGYEEMPVTLHTKELVKKEQAA